MSAIVPVAKTPIAIRAATMADLPFIDSLQKANCKALGYFPTKQFEEYIASGGVLVAEERSDEATKRRSDGGMERDSGPASSLSPHLSSPSSLRRSVAPSLPLGYCISRDRYLKRDELGVIFQLCVTPGVQRKLVGAALVQAVFERSAYGCRLYCCWCAQDLEANYFWESLGFVPIAFRAGSSGKKRVHIFWQRRIRAGDATTPWWFPAKTEQGAMRGDRIVLPIPPGLRWSDEMPVLKSKTPQAPRERRNRVRSPEVGEKVGPQEPTKKPRAAVQFGVPTAGPAVPVAPDPQPAPRPAKTPRPKETIDPQLVAKARELRDRYLEHVNAQDGRAIAAGKYDVSRALDAKPVRQLEAA